VELWKRLSPRWTAILYVTAKVGLKAESPAGQIGTEVPQTSEMAVVVRRVGDDWLHSFRDREGPRAASL
jgi:hypothetical protein